MLVRNVDILHHHTMRGVKSTISFYFLYMGIGGVGWWVNFFFFNYVICERQWERSDELQETLLISQMDLYLLQIHISQTIDNTYRHTHTYMHIHTHTAIHTLIHIETYAHYKSINHFCTLLYRLKLYECLSNENKSCSFNLWRFLKN